jgi:hypothetical protein
MSSLYPKRRWAFNLNKEYKCNLLNGLKKLEIK